MPRTPASPQTRRLVLVRAPAVSGRDDELVRRYRLACLRLAGRGAAETAQPQASSLRHGPGSGPLPIGS